MGLDKRRRHDAVSYQADLLLVLPVCLARNSDGLLLFEAQACNGMERWLDNFQRILVLCPVLTGEDLHNTHSTVWKPVSEIVNADRVRFVPLPYATSLASFTRAYLQGRSVIRRAIQQSRYLCFAIGGLFGDWGAVACLEAKWLDRPYAVWTDRVEHKVGLTHSANLNPPRRLKAHVRSRLMYLLERRCIRRASLGLFHGASCYAEYAPWCKTSYVVHDVHAKESDAIGIAQLDEKCSQIAAADPLLIIYAGRADDMKGPFDWVAVMKLLRDRGVAFQAIWLGDGPLLAEMRNQIVRHGLSELISLPGFVSNRAEVLARLRAAHLFVFCHITPESPRNLVEALISGCPIVGYHSDFAAELATDGGGVFVATGDKNSLVEQIHALDSNRSELVAVTRQAATSGKRFNDVAVFQHRSNLIKAHL